MATDINFTISGDGVAEETYTPRQVFNLYLEFIDPADEKLIDLEYITIHTENLIHNYSSEVMVNYRRLFKTIYQKFNNKKHQINNSSSELEVKNITSGDRIISIKKPKYLNVKDQIKLLEAKRLELKDILDFEYSRIIRIPTPSLENKSSVETIKSEYIELLNNLYVYKLYYAKINNILNDSNTDMVILQNLRPFIRDGIFNEAQPILDAKSYQISKTIIQEINTINGEKLDLFNTIKLNIRGQTSQEIGKNKQIYEMIVKYLDNSVMNDVNMRIKIAMENQDAEITEAILELPEINQNALKLL